MWQKLEIVTILALSQGSHNIRDPVSTAIAAAKIDAQIDAQWPHFSKQLSVQTISGRWRHRFICAKKKIANESTIVTYLPSLKSGWLDPEM